MKKKFLFAFAAMMLAPGMSLAEVKPPAEFDRVPGLTPHENIFGMQAWTDDASKMLWLHDEASGQIIVGYALDEKGQVIHPALKDTPVGIDTLIDDIFNLNEVTIPEPYIASVEELLQLLDEDLRVHSIRDFVLRLRGVETEAAYNTAVEGWINELKALVKEHNPDVNVDQIGMAQPAASPEAQPETQMEATEAYPASTGEEAPAVPAKPPAAVPTAVDDASADGANIAPAEPTNTQVAIQGVQGELGADGNPRGIIWEPEVVDGVSLREALRKIPSERMGRGETGNVVTVLLDPTCIECQTSWHELRRAMRSGDISFDIHVVPAYSEDSYAIIAGMNPEEPVMRTVTRAISGNELELGRWSEVSEEDRAKYYARQDLIRKYAIPALPLFISDTKYAAGALTPELLQELIAE